MSDVTPAFFSSVRTSPDLKAQTEDVLKALGLSWSAFINNAARTLVYEKKVEFSMRDSAGFTQEKGDELRRELDLINTGQAGKKMNLKDSQNFLLHLEHAD